MRKPATTFRKWLICGSLVIMVVTGTVACGSSLPALSVRVGQQHFNAVTSGYSWGTRDHTGSSTVADAANKPRKGLARHLVAPGSVVYLHVSPKPDRMTLQSFQNGKVTSKRQLMGSSFTAPEAPGTYIYEIHAAYGTQDYVNFDFSLATD